MASCVCIRCKGDGHQLVEPSRNGVGHGLLAIGDEANAEAPRPRRLALDGLASHRENANRRRNSALGQCAGMSPEPVPDVTAGAIVLNDTQRDTPSRPKERN
jgi:hypothetical protein